MHTLPDSLKIGVIRGGISPEYEVSLKTGAHILELLSETHRPIDIFISRDGVWHMQGIEKSPERILKNVDVVWNALHGAYGEDGKIQELLNHHGIKFNGSDKYPSALAMNKFLTKEHLKDLGIKTPTYTLVRIEDDLKERSREIFETVPHPLIIKPVSGGSSLGIKIAKNYNELYAGLYDILSAGENALVEELISGKEATVGVIDDFRGHKIYSLPPVEIRYALEHTDNSANTSDYFNFESKYNGESQEICPGNFTESEKKEIEEIAKKVHEKLGLRHYSRSDFIVTPKRGIYFLEVNTLPGMTKESLFPLALKSVGSSVKEFVHHIMGILLKY